MRKVLAVILGLFFLLNGLISPGSFSANAAVKGELNAQVPITIDGLLVVNDNYATLPGSVLNKTAGDGLLSNDTDAVNAAEASLPANGALTLVTDGSFEYTPTSGWHGVDSFTYSAEEAGNPGTTQTGTVTITVNTNPVAANDSLAPTEDAPLIFAKSALLANDTDADGDPLTVAAFTAPAQGSLLDNLDGTLTYTPAANYCGSDGFTYINFDTFANSTNAGVDLAVACVNDWPVANNDSFNATEDTPRILDKSTILSNDTDIELDPLSMQSYTQPMHGSLADNGDGTLTYTPGANFYGSDNFNYTASDGNGGSGTAQVSIIVASVTEAPIAANDIYSTNEDTNLNVDPVFGVLGNDVDPDGDALSAEVVTGPAHGALALNTNGSFAYTPFLNYAGSDTFVYQASDGGLTDTATVTITINPVNNDPPIAVDDEITISEDLPAGVRINVLANDIVVDTGFPLDNSRLEIITYAVGGDTLVNVTTGQILYTPFPNWNGTDLFTYQICDVRVLCHNAAVIVEVQAVNDAPVADDDSYTVAEDTLRSVSAAEGVLAGDTDIEGDTLTAVLVVGSGPSHAAQFTLNADGSFFYRAAANYTGTDSFTYRVQDNGLPFPAASQPATVTLTITPVNDAPTAANDSYNTPEDTPLTIPAPGVLGNDNDIENNPLTAVLVSAPASGTLTLNPNGSFTYTPPLNFTGPVTFTYHATDGGPINSNTATVTINVGVDNDPPVAVNNTYSVNEDTTLNIVAPGVLGNDTDPEGDSLTTRLVEAPVNGTLTLNANGSFVYTPGENFYGADSFRYQARDGQVLSVNTATVTITINSVNDAPAAADDTFLQTGAANMLTISLTEILANDIDVEDGQNLTASIVPGSAQNGTVAQSPPGTGDIVFTFTPGYTGAAQFSYEVSDTGNLKDTAIVFLTIDSVIPSAIWVDPAPSGGTYEADPAFEFIKLVAEVKANISPSDIDRIVFRRYHHLAESGYWVDIQEISSGGGDPLPDTTYEVYLETRDLLPGTNQLRVYVYDRSGNVEYSDVLRITYSGPQIYLPVVGRNQ